MNPEQKQTITTEDLHRKLLAANSNSTSNRDLHIDIGAMLVLLIGNPLSLYLQVIQAGNQIEISTATPSKQVGRLAIYSDPIAGGTFVRPDVLPVYRQLGHGSVLYLAAARLIWLDKKELLHSNHHHLQLTEKAARIWQEFVKNGWAVQHGPNQFSIRQNVAESFAAAQILDTFLQHNQKVADCRNDTLAKDIPSPSELRTDMHPVTGRNLWLYNPSRLRTP